MAPIQVCMGLSANTAISKGHGEFLHNTREKWQERTGVLKVDRIVCEVG